MKLTIDLSEWETNLVLNSLQKEYNNALRRKWKASEKAVHCASINSIRNRIVGAQYEARKQGEEVGEPDRSVESHVDKPSHDE